MLYDRRWCGTRAISWLSILVAKFQVPRCSPFSCPCLYVSFGCFVSQPPLPGFCTLCLRFKKFPIQDVVNLPNYFPCRLAPRISSYLYV
ncbi:hypothetical protein B0T24DRAFT_601274 [Lasiosphaeria ovina]|uniref:Secreted protein n=1 Tax=Lasiosphaeria ovina TaxID=92902 RepID=A0AAE0TWS2_9PEZI|nr:hypothetical protein B0T24DRAFT_601274 [Lasiosphaeria ovina]